MGYFHVGSDGIDSSLPNKFDHNQSEQGISFFMLLTEHPESLEFPDFYAEYFCNLLITKQILFFIREHHCPFASVLPK
jgi:hypothetical protein